MDKCKKAGIIISVMLGLGGRCDIQLMLGYTGDVTAEYFSGRSGEMSIEVSSTMTTRQTIAIAQVSPVVFHQTDFESREVKNVLQPEWREPTKKKSLYSSAQPPTDF